VEQPLFDYSGVSRSIKIVLEFYLFLRIFYWIIYEFLLSKWQCSESSVKYD